MTHERPRFAVILAGGSGTRFWPESRGAAPKQLLALGHDGTPLLAATVERALAHVPPDRVVVVTAERLMDASRRVAPALPKTCFLGEPSPRNTSAAIAWANAVVMKEHPDAVIGVFPADQSIADRASFSQSVALAFRAAEDGGIVTLGIQPTRPETGYGYIELGDAIDERIARVARFVEKPDARRAAEFVASRRHLWNAGMFFYLADHMDGALRAHVPDVHSGVARFLASSTDAERAAAFAQLPSISIDYGVMERVSDVRVVRDASGWSDVGSYATAWELAPKDINGNATPPSAVCIDARRNLVRTKRELTVALLGVDDLIVVDTGDALLIAPRDRAQDVRGVVDELKRRGRTDLL